MPKLSGQAQVFAPIASLVSNKAPLIELSTIRERLVSIGENYGLQVSPILSASCYAAFSAVF